MSNEENDLSSFSMLDLFRTELENQVSILNDGLLALEKDPGASKVLETLMRAAHSLKGAARIVQIDPAVKVAHALEDCFVAAQKGNVVLKPEKMDVVLEGIDFLSRIGKLREEELTAWLPEQETLTESLVSRIAHLTAAQAEQASTPASSASSKPLPVQETDSRMVRIRAENLNRLLAYAAENSIAAATLESFVDSLRVMKNQQRDLTNTLGHIKEILADLDDSRLAEEALSQAVRIHQDLSSRYSELEVFSRRAVNLTKRLYAEVLDSRMRPFREGVEALPRMVRDVSRQLGKKVKFEITGKRTKVDRDILERLEAPLNHLLRNALDHGIESPNERLTAGKSEEGSLLLEASHKGGVLHIQVTDDGRGVNFQKLRNKLVDKKLVTAELVNALSEQELLEFLFLPGFSTSDQVTELSGRGVGLDVVYNMVREVGGQIEASSELNKGMTIHLQLPITLSMLRTLVVEISGETYAFPLSRIDKTLFVPYEEFTITDGDRYADANGKSILVLDANELLKLPGTPCGDTAPIIVVSDSEKYFGIVVDRFLMQKDLVVRPLDSRLGKVKNIYAASVLQDGSPVLILDVQDMLRSIHQLLAKRHQRNVDDASRRILIIEDSVTVRDFEQKLLTSYGFLVDVAVDGMDGWNAIKTATYDLVITDLDMPRMDGIELTRRIRSDPKLRDIPLVMVSYKERKEDRDAALQAGANRYLSKNSFHDETFLRTIRELIGERGR